MKGIAPVIVLANDKALYNARYRSYLLVELEKLYGDGVLNIGTTESPAGFFQFFRFAILGIPVVSSNLKSNVLSLLLFSRGILILNGLGRHQKSSIFRRLLIWGVFLNRSRKQFFVQRYRDYRWLRRFVKGIEVEWMLGSGVKSLKITADETPGTYVTISRPEKLRIIEKQLIGAAEKLRARKILIYGVDANYQLQTQPGFTVSFMGYVRPNEFFAQSKNFLQVDGYGEGFPHTLAYALCSNTNVTIDKKLSRSLGMYRLPVKRSSVGEGFETLEAFPRAVDMLSNAFVYKNIINRIANIVNNS